MSYTDRVTQVIDWLKLSDEIRPRFISLYLSEVDSAGHEHGPDSIEVKEAIQLVDETVKSLVDQVNELPFADSVNFLIVSDHGMAKIGENQTIYLDDYINIIDDAQVITWGPLTSIRALKGRAAQLHYQLQAIENADVFYRDEIPYYYHYSENDRIPDIILVAKEGWTVSSHDRIDTKIGDHGYYPTFGSMRAFLIAFGDFFKVGYSSEESFLNIHLYSLMAKMLNIAAAPNNGSWVSLCPFLDNKC